MGYFKLERGWSDNIVFDNEPLTQREAWVWLIEHAAWREAVMSVGKDRYKVQRGQLAASVRYLALRWQWSKDRVWRFLGKLETETMIATAPRQHASIITICNYAKYQDQRDGDETATATDSATAPRQQRDKEEGTLSIEAKVDAADAVTPKGERRGKQLKARIDGDWQPSAEDRAIPEGLGLNADAERDSFVDWSLANGKLYASPSAGYRNWCRNTARYRDERTARHGGVANRQGPSSSLAAAGRAAARFQGRSGGEEF